MDTNLRAVTLAAHAPLWVKLLPLAFVALVAYGVITGAPADREPPPRDVSSQVRPH